MKNIIRQQFQASPFHLVENSPWPATTSFALMSLALNFALTFHGYIASPYWIFLSLVVVTYSMGLWFRDIISEGTYLGSHTIAVKKGLNIGFILFVIAELFTFIGVFWAYAHSSLSPTIELGLQWPPMGIEAIAPTDLPLLNTILLLSSGATLTWSHHALIAKDRSGALYGLILTVVLALIFTVCQYFEYITSTFTFADGVYGTVFYAGTGLHGIHVMLGTAMLAVSAWRLYTYQLTSTHHVGYETSILYWHFVDVVWLFLFILFYWWGS